MKTCAQCGVTHTRSTATFCLPCAQQRQKTRIAPATRKRPGSLKGLRTEDGGFACLDCLNPLPPAVSGGRNVRSPLRCWECNHTRYLIWDTLTGKAAANAAVSRARREGQIPPATAFKCTDCDRPAEHYDHRDYNEPLKVEPVCRSCNVMRGSAIPFNPYLVGLLLIAASQSSPA